MRILLVPVTLLLLSAATPPALGDDCADYTNPAHFVDRISVHDLDTGSDGTDLRAIDIAWPYAYVGGFRLGWVGPYFQIIDLSAGDGPKVVGSLVNSSVSILDLEIHGNLIYAANDRFEIIDVSDPTAPLVTGSVELPGYAFGISVVPGAGMAYAACKENGLVAIDVSDPTAPAVVGSLVHGGGLEVNGVAVAYPYAYLALFSQDGFEVVDVSDPAAMVTVASLPLRPYSVTVAENLVYGAIYDGNGTDDGLRIIDVNDPLAPAVVGTISGWDPKTIRVFDGLAYAGNQIFDVSDPTQPTHVRQMNLQVASPAKRPVAVHDGTIYAAAGGRLTVAGYGIEVGACDQGGALVPPVGELSDCLVYAMRFRGDLGYVFGNSHVDGSNYQPLLSLYDVTDPATPLLIRTQEFGDASQQSTIDGNGTHAFLTSEYELVAVDVTTPLGLPTVGSLLLDFEPTGSWLEGDHLYLVDAEYPARGLRVYDVSDPTAMSQIGYLEIDATEQEIYDVEVRGNYAYVPRGFSVATGASGLEIIEISDPTQPTLVATVPFPDRASSVALAGDHAWVAYGNTGYDHALRMAAIDVSDPLTPVIVHDLGVPFETNEITISGDYLYTVSGFQGPGIIDITDPLNARAIGSIDAGFARGSRIATAGDHIYVNSRSGHGSVRVYAPQCTDVTAAPPAAPMAYALRAYPNPFNPSVTLAFDITSPQRVRVSIFDLAGRNVATLLDEALDAGTRAVTWRGVDDTGNAVSSGVYFARVEGPRNRQMIKVTLLK